MGKSLAFFFVFVFCSILGFAGRTYHIVGNLMSRFNIMPESYFIVTVYIYVKTNKKEYPNTCILLLEGIKEVI